MTQMAADKGTSADWHLRKSASSADNSGLESRTRGQSGLAIFLGYF